VNFFVWANNFSNNTGEGRLARNFITLIKKKYPNSSIIIKTPHEKFLFNNNKNHIVASIYINTFFYKYISFFYGIYYLWKYRKKKRIIYLNYLPLWNFLIFLLLPKKTILGPITGGVNFNKINNIENIIRISLFPIFYQISLFIIKIKFRKAIFSTNLLKKYAVNGNNYFFGYIYNLFSNKSYSTNKIKTFDLIFYNRNYNSKKNYLVKKIIFNLQHKIKVCIVGDRVEDDRFSNKGYVTHKKILKLISQSKIAFGTSENLLSLFAIDCYNSGVKLVYDKNTLLNNVISNKNSTVIDYENFSKAAKIISNLVNRYKFTKDDVFINYVKRKKLSLKFFLRDYF
jgi:hypothetical protein